MSQSAEAYYLIDHTSQPVFVRAQKIEERNQPSASNPSEEHKNELDAKRQALEQRLAERRAAVTEKLSGERAELCKRKEQTINQTLDNRVDAAQRHFDKLKDIHGKLAAFVTEKELSVNNANALELILGEKQADAQATIDAVKALDFECTIADAHAPGAIVIDQMTEAKQALKDYRTAIKDYAVAIRSAATPSTDRTGDSTDTSEQSEEVAQ